MNLNDEDILLRLNAFEDSFVERKTANDSKDWLKTVVAFANSAPIGEPAILFIGVRDNGIVEEQVNLDSLQRTLSEKLAAAYPAIYYLSKVLRRDGKQFLAVIVPGSESRPHFAGPAYVRDGSQTISSSAKLFDTLIAERSSKVREIRKWKDKTVTFKFTDVSKHPETVFVLGSVDGQIVGKLTECSLFYVTAESVVRKGNFVSIPIRIVEINFDHHRGCLELRVI